jgi:signal peptidase I
MARAGIWRRERRRSVRAKRRSSLAETTRFLLFVFLFAVILRSFIVAPFVIPSGSMLPRLLIGDFLFVTKFPYGYSRFAMPFGLGSFEGRIAGRLPDRGDVAVFRSPSGADEDVVKRVIGLPGDRVQVRGGTVYLNDRAVPKVRVADFLMPLSPNTPCRSVDVDAARLVEGEGGERFCAFPRYRETLPGGRSYYVLDQVGAGPADDTAVFRVPEGHIFTLGDNRDDSLDSRFPRSLGGIGFLPTDYLIGEALVTFFSTDGSAEWLKPWTWFTAGRWSRVGETF